MSQLDKIKEILDRRGIRASDELCAEADRLCYETGMKPNRFVNEVDAMVTNKNLDSELTEDLLKRIEASNLPQGRKYRPKTLGGPTKVNAKHMDKNSIKAVPGYDASLEYQQKVEDPPVGQKRASPGPLADGPSKRVVQHTLPSTTNNKNVSGTGSRHDPLHVAVSAGNKSTYNEREGAGLVSSEFNESMPVRSEPFLHRQKRTSTEAVIDLPEDQQTDRIVEVCTSIPSDILECTREVSTNVHGGTNLESQENFLYSKLKDRATGIYERMKDFDEIAQVDGSDYDCTITGKVRCNAEGKLNSTSVELELIHANENGSKKMHLNLSALNNITLFPGQMVTAQGARESASSLHVTKLTSKALLPLPRSPRSLVDKEHSIRNISGHTAVPVRGGGPMRVWMAGGPFTLDEDLDFKPLLDLISEVQNDNVGPDLLILMGPFLPDYHPLVSRGELTCRGVDKLFTNTEIWRKKVLKAILKLLQSMPHLQVIILPAPDDVIPYPIFPTAPFDLSFSKKDTEAGKRLHMVSNPSSFTVGDGANRIVFAGLTPDILFDIRRERCVKGDKEFMAQSNKLEALMEDLLGQHCFYPLIPGNADVPLDTSLSGYLRMPLSPDVLFVRSRLKPFASDMNGTLGINVGKLTSFNRGGSFAKLYINPIDLEKADQEGEAFQHHVPERTKVEIVSI